eukprot:m.64731 g.64731  ORF g.64731 m.64731 type:complete len:1013 (+) comp13611_c0_seq4:2238-5276(+)
MSQEGDVVTTPAAAIDDDDAAPAAAATATSASVTGAEDDAAEVAKVPLRRDTGSGGLRRARANRLSSSMKQRSIDPEAKVTLPPRPASVMQLYEGASDSDSDHETHASVPIRESADFSAGLLASLRPVDPEDIHIATILEDDAASQQGYEGGDEQLVRRPAPLKGMPRALHTASTTSADSDDFVIVGSGSDTAAHQAAGAEKGTRQDDGTGQGQEQEGGKAAAETAAARRQGIVRLGSFKRPGATESTTDAVVADPPLQSEESDTSSDRPASLALSPRQASKRTRALAELVDTEANYVESLDAIVNGYMHVIAPEVLSNEEKLVVFGNTELLLEFHTDLLKLLRDAQGQGKADAVVSVALLFLSCGEDFLDLYSEYCGNHDRSCCTLKARQSDAALQQTITQTQELLGHRLPLASFLLQPVQRLMRYALLLRELLQAVTPAEPGYEPLCEALDQMQKISADINRAKRERELNAIVSGEVIVTRTQSLQERLAANGFEGDISCFGQLIDDANDIEVVTEPTSARGRKPSSAHGARSSRRHLFLFQLALLACKERSDSGISVKDIFLVKSVWANKVDAHTFSVTDEQETMVFRSQVLNAGDWVDKIRQLATEACGTMSPQVTKSKRFRLLARKRTATIESVQRSSSRKEQGTSGSSPALERSATVSGSSADGLSSPHQHPRRRHGSSPRLALKQRHVLLTDDTANDDDPTAMVPAEVLEREKEKAIIAKLEADMLAAERETEAQRAIEQEAAAQQARARAADLEAQKAAVEGELEVQRRALEAERVKLAEHQAQARELERQQQVTRQAQALAQQLAVRQAESQLHIEEQQEILDQERARLAKIQLQLDERHAADMLDDRLARKREHLRGLVWAPLAAAGDEAWQAAHLEAYVYSALRGPVPDPGEGLHVFLEQHSCRGFLSILSTSWFESWLEAWWAPRWFVLSMRTRHLKYFKSNNARHERGAIPLTDICRVVLVGNIIHLVLPTRTYRLLAPTETSAKIWEHTLNVFAAAST